MNIKIHAMETKSENSLPAIYYGNGSYILIAGISSNRGSGMRISGNGAIGEYRTDWFIPDYHRIHGPVVMVATEA